jgi:PAS domain-containing protein
MPWQITPLVLQSLIAGAIAAVFFVVFWRRRFAPCGLSLALMAAGLTLLALTVALNAASVDLPLMVFWAKIGYAATVITVTCFVVFAIEYTGNGEWLTRRTMVLLAIIPSVTILLCWTNDWHGLFWTKVWIDHSSSFATLRTERGFWAWVAAVYCYLLGFLALALLTLTFLRAPGIYRRQAGAVLLAGLALIGIAIMNTANMSGLAPNPGLNLLPFAIAIAGLALFFGVFSFRLSDIMPVARATVLEGIREGVIVMDAQQRIVDLNPAAQSILGLRASAAVGRLAADVFSQ